MRWVFFAAWMSCVGGLVACSYGPANGLGNKDDMALPDPEDASVGSGDQGEPLDGTLVPVHDGSTVRDMAVPADLSAVADLSPLRDMAMPPRDLSSGVLDVVIFADNFCKISTNPPSFGVPAGVTFTVNWINRPDSDYDVDVVKADRFHPVAIVLGLEPGNRYHDTIRNWCISGGPSTFSFSISTACGEYLMPINCNL